jgi:hypothetical protein
VATKGFVQKIEELSLTNTDFRRVLYTGKHSQLVLMALPPGKEIGTEAGIFLRYFGCTRDNSPTPPNRLRN